MKSVAVFAGSKVGQRPWRPGKKVWSIAVFAASEVDFRQAELDEGTTQVVAVAMFGANKVVIPQDTLVTLGGCSIFGARRDERSQAKEAPPAAAKALHVDAISVFGACTVTEESVAKASPRTRPAPTRELHTRDKAAPS